MIDINTRLGILFRSRLFFGYLCAGILAVLRNLMDMTFEPCDTRHAFVALVKPLELPRSASPHLRTFFVFGLEAVGSGTK
jgi:hypothetical protein